MVRQSSCKIFFSVLDVKPHRRSLGSGYKRLANGTLNQVNWLLVMEVGWLGLANCDRVG